MNYDRNRYQIPNLHELIIMVFVSKMAHATVARNKNEFDISNLAWDNQDWP